MIAPSKLFVSAGLLAMIVVGCSSGSSSSVDGTGGMTAGSGSGGRTAGTGGARGTGGSPGTGGAVAGSGGAARSGTGGSPGTGGAVAGSGGAAPSGTGGAVTGSGGATPGSGGRSGGGGTFTLTSATLPDGAMFPVDSTCETTMAASQLPDLTWTGAPAGTMSFAMVFVDTSLIDMTPPNPNGFHSAMWDIPASVSMLPKGLPAGSPPTGVAGLETVKQKKAPSGMAWLGPCPNFPSTTRTRTDRYAFRLYALGQASLPANTSTMTIQQIMTTIEALAPLGVAVLTGHSNAAGTMLK